MEWVLRSPQIHSTFSNLGFAHSDGYHINQNCNEFLEVILKNIKAEDKYLRTYRRNISFGRNIEKDLIPLFLNAKDDITIELLIKILVNLTIPVECLLLVDVISKTDFGRHTIFEINNLLTSTKEAFTDQRATKVLIDFLKKNLKAEQYGTTATDFRTNISNSLLLLRNILHIPEYYSSKIANYSGSLHSVQNQIIWNLFSQSIDSILIKLMTGPNANYWAVTMVQLIALFYKDQHVVVLQKLLNTWLESSSSESSGDNESNTSQPGRGSDNSSPMLTSDPTSDSSDTGVGVKSNKEPNSISRSWEDPSPNDPAQNGRNDNKAFESDVNIPLQEEKAPTITDVKDCVQIIPNTSMNSDTLQDTVTSSAKHSSRSDPNQNMSEKKNNISEISDCGYGTQIENQETVSTATSSNDDEPEKKPVHQKPHNPKQRVNAHKSRFGSNPLDRKMKKVPKRRKSKIVNVHGQAHQTPTDEDIANIIKEFTVNFLLKGYNTLVKTLLNEILTNLKLEIDISHFFWLVTYFLKFASQIELDLLNLESVLLFDIVSYLTAEGVYLCEQFDMAIKVEGSDLIPHMRRLHLVVTSIRELVQAIETYEKFPYLKNEARESLVKLQIKMCETSELRSLLVLLLRHYSPRHHSKQYLQDLIVTNHILLTFLDNSLRSTNHNSAANIMSEHIQQFATSDVMHQYGVLLEDFMNNGQFVNDCIFTMMHHVSGESNSLITLFQPKILSSFSSIWKSEFEMCDDWSDLIEFVVNTFIKKPETLSSTVGHRLKTESFEDDDMSESNTCTSLKRKASSLDGNASTEIWTKDEISSLGWLYVQCKNDSNSENIFELTHMLKDEGIHKSRDSIIRELFKQKCINNDTFQKLMKAEGVEQKNNVREDEISKLCEQLTQDGKSTFLKWVQSVLLDCCQVKIYLEKRKLEKCEADETKLLNFELFKKKICDGPVLSPVAYYSLITGRSIPLVPWNCNQATICRDLKFLQLLHKLGFHMPVDTGKIFIRIPHFWTADFFFETAKKLWRVDHSKLAFSVNELSEINSRPSEVAAGALPLAEDAAALLRRYHAHKDDHLPKRSCSYYSDANEVPGGNYNWLKIIQQSKDAGITLAKLESFKEDPSAAPPSVSVRSVAGELDAHNDDCNSVCETESVASDLTRMYVSDEEERPENAGAAPRPATKRPKLRASPHR